MSKKTLLVIGGGAAGFFCAVNAARLNPALTVIIAEKSGQVLRKVKISGGGRCNVTHACFDIQAMASCYPRGERFLRKAFHRFFTTDTIEWFQSRGVPLKAESDGRMFPQADTSQAIIDCLINEMHRYKVQLILHFQAEKIEALGQGFYVYHGSGERLFADYVMIACGGFSQAAQFDWLRNLKLHMEDPVPSLFTFNFPGHPLNRLMGIAVTDANIKMAGSKKNSAGPILITHWGLSGPAVLRLSSFCARELAKASYRFTVQINWCGAYREQSMAEKIREQRTIAPSRKIINGNFTGIAGRLWEFLLTESGIEDSKRWADATTTMINQLARNCTAYEMTANGKTTFKEEFVNAGGIALSEIDVNSMMSRQQEGLYFGGEILDVDGITGGYNFQHAWTSGFIAATHIAASR